MKRRIVINGPCYKNELSIYRKETLDKIDGFRRARTHWLATADESQKTSTKVKEGMQESNIYKGRCSCLRKIGLKTTLLRVHYKNFRPAKYWTFRRKLLEHDIDEYDELTEQEEVTKRGPKRQLSRMVCSSSDIWKKGDLEECLRDASKIKGRQARKRQKQKCKEKEISGPCQKAIRRLKAAKIRDGIIESCRCEDGREVTVVIKGICLCDKTNLGKVNLNKVCDEFSKMQKPPLQPVEGADVKNERKETITPDKNEENEDKTDDETGYLHVVDSAETYRRLKTSHELEGKVQSDEDTVDTNAKKKLTFENEKNLKGDGGQRPPTKSDITLYRRLSSGFLNKSDTNVKPNTKPPESSTLPLTSPLKHDPILGISKPPEVPQSESLNNLLLNDDKGTKVKGQLKKYSATLDGKPPEQVKPSEQVKSLELVHVTNSLEIYRKQWKKHKKEELDKTEQTQEDLGESVKDDKTPERKTKVRLSKKATIIPPIDFPVEKLKQETPTPNPETKSPLLETHDMVTYSKSQNENKMENKVEEKALESKSKASVSSRPTSEVNPDMYNKSIVTLYKNEPEAKSEMGLTKEEQERLKQVEREKQKSQEEFREISRV